MAKRKRKRGSGRGDRRGGRTTSGGRVQPKPPWEPAWRRASRAAVNLWWMPDPGSADLSDGTAESIPPHGSVFRALDALASSDDGLGTLAALADIYDQTAGVVEVEAHLRAVAEMVTDRSEAALFSGYITPSTASASDSSAMAGRLLRAFRDRDLGAMVDAANANPQVFSSRPYAGVLALAPLVVYELTRSDDDTPLNDGVADFLGDCDIPIAGAEELVGLILIGLVSRNFPDELNEHMATEVAGQVEANRPLVDGFMKYCLRLEAVMNVCKTAASLQQCGANLGASFASESALLATMASETPALRRFQNHEPPSGSTYGLWLTWLKAISPKGFTHRTVGAFSPDDLATAVLADLDTGPLERLQHALVRQAPLTVTGLEAAVRALALRVEWLTGLAALLVGRGQPSDLFTVTIAVKHQTWGFFGPAGPSAAVQELYLLIVTVHEIEEGEGGGSVLDSDELRSNITEHAARCGFLIEQARREGDFAEDELRSLVAWLELLTETMGVEAREPPDGFDLCERPDRIEIWLSHACWWTKHRGWRPPKERPAIEEIEAPIVQQSTPAPTVVAPTEEPWEPLVPDRRVSVIFAGGDERQARNDTFIDQDVADRYGELVTVEWVHIDWSARWSRDAERICGRIKRGADVVILMPLVRTGMGQYLRRESGKLGVPWVPCTGRGRTSVNASIDDAVQVVCRLRTSV